VYDVVTYAYELDLLRIRVTELGNVVDTFFVAVCDRSFSGAPLTLDLNFSSFGPLATKVHLVFCDETWPNGTNPWVREGALRDHGFTAVKKVVQPGDIVIFSDVDEIPSAEVVRQLLRHSLKDGLVHLRMPLYKYSFGCVDQRFIGQSSWCGALALGGERVLAETSGAAVRGLGHDCRSPGPHLFCSGWHCSNCMRPDVVRLKFVHFSHAKDQNMIDFNGKVAQNLSFLKNHMHECKNTDDSNFRRVRHMRGLPEAVWMDYTRYLQPKQ